MSKYIHMKGKRIVFPVSLVVVAREEKDGWTDLTLNFKLARLDGSDLVSIPIGIDDYVKFLESDKVFLDVYD